MLRYLSIEQKGATVKVGDSLTYPKDDTPLWVYLASPTPEEISAVSQDFFIEPRLFLDYKHQVRSKRYSTNPLQFVMVDYYLNNYAVIRKTNILFIIKKNILITVLPHKLRNYEEFFQEITEDITHWQKKERNIGRVLYEFLDRDVQENYDVLRTTEEDIITIEKTILSERNHNPITNVLALRKDLAAMGRRFWATAKIIFLIKKGLVAIAVSPTTLHLLDDVYDTFHHQISIIATQRDMLKDALTLYETVLSNKLSKSTNDLNQIMKTLTALTLLVMIPTLIASIYGMNFQTIPGASRTTGFYEAIATMLIAGGILYLYFHRKGWI